MAERSVKWADGALVAIDQRALPHQVRWLRITTVDELIDAIKTLAIRGAPAIGVSGAFGVALAAFAHVGDAQKVELEAARIAAARPTAVNLAWGVQRALARLPQGARAVLDEAREMLAEGERVNRAAATHAADLVQRLCPDRRLRILTHCDTGPLATAAFGTALGALQVLHTRHAIDEVLVDETRPLLQGARLATWELAQAGIPHRLAVDSAAAWAMATGQVDCVLVGADRISADGSVANKIGTYGLALAARHHGIPFVVVAPESTRDPGTATGRDIVVEQRSAGEITHLGDVATAPADTAVFNPAFDVTPPELITAVVTENGVIGEAKHVAASQIPRIARDLYLRGWMPGTAGNISVRAGQAALITGSGLSKGELTAEDLVSVNIADSQQLSGSRRPSAETAIHTAIYRATDAQAVVHVHPPHATTQSIGAPKTLRFSGYELIKGLSAADRIDIPVFANHADVARIGAEIQRHLSEHPDAPPVLFVAGHGVTAWGADLAQARDRVECLEAMCELVTLTGRRDIGTPSEEPS
ncbi:bifunctional S-methyl-5-thioribose-1-phosphate isomerase/methylthioribulose 1-phosphate dehydratase [Mycobacterium heckeshornense]|uniref:Methylthioribose-1-phosphate isomerase n=1 Tax=Mycobacterium heckeshornense TaxID=110505 RepID=A0A2G8BDK2_9MYCO|nr:bifunctional S-methyl-5-thioribose-1-phosphate isomerase/methylthioribulose 1-phosphate dehydratase [Mycobacterium heckeshornense]KMV17723.1 methylthioribulose-1-phosphate dehydratase [Mycobacterium heckeshornense]MCV7036872.1 bifunctional S-methyl-5-thioribose-1-phosphate isomerase/methylthioribulose 1-phosphate dehydratase [Mycobacterium heckeshornense]PIJ35837.1 bifunctional S-methyl-5-thioribose-1-phosphate isomerase/methylthioribulose 1-phosphate dehydratase [Mycobacterium heckeshornense